MSTAKALGSGYAEQLGEVLLIIQQAMMTQPRANGTEYVAREGRTLTRMVIRTKQPTVTDSTTGTTTIGRRWRLALCQIVSHRRQDMPMSTTSVVMSGNGRIAAAAAANRRAASYVVVVTPSTATTSRVAATTPTTATTRTWALAFVAVRRETSRRTLTCEKLV